MLLNWLINRLTNWLIDQSIRRFLSQSKEHTKGVCLTIPNSHVHPSLSPLLQSFFLPQFVFLIRQDRETFLSEKPWELLPVCLDNTNQDGVIVWLSIKQLPMIAFNQHKIKQHWDCWWLNKIALSFDASSGDILLLYKTLIHIIH